MTPAFKLKIQRPFTETTLRAAREAELKAALDAGLGEILAWDICAITDELACNIMEHSDATWLEWTLSVENYDSATLVFRDNGVRFDVVRATAAADSEAGDGTHRHLGLLMVRRVVQSIEYNRLSDGSNELTLCAGPPARRAVAA